MVWPMRLSQVESTLGLGGMRQLSGSPSRSAKSLISEVAGRGIPDLPIHDCFNHDASVDGLGVPINSAVASKALLVSFLNKADRDPVCFPLNGLEAA